MKVESQKLGKRWMVVMETPKLEFVEVDKGVTTSARTLTVTETLTKTLTGQGGGGGYDQVRPFFFLAFHSLI